MFHIFQLEFGNAVFISEVHIYETFNGGAVKRISALNKPDTWVDIWSGQPTHVTSSRIFKPSLNYSSFSTNVIKLYLDCTVSGSWAEIDAVKLIGEPGNVLI